MVILTASPPHTTNHSFYIFVFGPCRVSLVLSVVSPFQSCSLFLHSDAPPFFTRVDELTPKCFPYCHHHFSSFLSYVPRVGTKNVTCVVILGLGVNPAHETNVLTTQLGLLPSVGPRSESVQTTQEFPQDVRKGYRKSQQPTTPSSQLSTTRISNHYKGKEVIVIQPPSDEKRRTNERAHLLLHAHAWPWKPLELRGAPRTVSDA